MAEKNYHIMNMAAKNVDVQRDWMWIMSIPEIDSIIPTVGNDQNAFKSRIRSALIPGSTIAPLDSNFMGTKWFYPGKKEPTSEMSCQFEETEDSFVFSTFTSWMNLIQQQDHQKDPNGVAALPNKKSMVKDAFIELLDYAGNVRRRIQLWNCWPTSIDTPALSYESAAIIKFGVNFNFDNWTVQL